MSIYDFRESPRCPYGNLRWEKYYWVYPRPDVNYDEEYWGTTKDPDGITRNMLSAEEREKQLSEMEYILERIHEKKPGRLIDVGCGPGYLLSAISDEWEKHGVDISQAALNHAMQHAIVKKGALTDLEYPRGYFDALIMHHIIEHLNDPIRYIEESRRVLKKGGLAVISTPDFDCGCARRFKDKYRMLHDKGHISLFTQFSLIRMLEDHGFRILEVEYPFFETQWFSKDNLFRMMDTSKTSPPFYGNHVTVFAEKR